MHRHKPGGSTSDLPHHPAKAGTDTREYRDPHPRSFELTELAERIPIPLGSPITLRTLLGHRFQLDRFLIGIGDLPYVSGRAAELYNEEKGTSPTWSDLYWNCPPPLLDEVVATADQGVDGRRSGGCGIGGFQVCVAIEQQS